ncbi:diacylglycerol kinase family protein [Oscillospiraceae bacterium PP1C4]
MSCKLKSLVNSFKYAFSGIRHCMRCERNFRIHVVAAAYVMLLAALLQLDRMRFAVLLLTIANVLVMEMLNTAIETLVDLASPQQHPLAKIAKDVAAGAVLVSAATSVGVGFWLLWQPDKLVVIAEKLLDTPSAFISVIISLLFALWIVFGTKEK